MKKFVPHIYFFMALITISTQAFSQTKTVSGSVVSALSEPLVGVNIGLKGTTMGTVSDANGNFGIEIPEDQLNTAILIFSYIGFVTKEVAIAGQTTMTVTLADDAKSLSEVVVTGYQSEERKKILGAVNTVSPDLIVKVPVSGIDQALQGRVPGVVVTQNTGAPGEGVIVRIRGVGSLNSNNQPLYIIDGIPTLDATFVAPQDIQSLTVLKDASAAALYGARAANGVILITTKSGTSGKMTVNYSTQIGVQAPVRLVPMATTSQYVSIYNEAANNDNPDFPTILQRPLITPQIASTFAALHPSKIQLRIFATS